MEDTGKTVVLYDPENDKIGPGTEVVQVRDRVLSAAMLAVGIHLRRDPPYVYVKSMQSGKVTRTYNHFPKTQNGDITASDCIKAYKQDLDFLRDNPKHPFAFALAACKNLIDYMVHEQEKDPIPRVCFEFVDEQGQSAVLLVKEGSKKYQAALDRGLTPL